MKKKSILLSMTLLSSILGLAGCSNNVSSGNPQSQTNTTNKITTILTESSIKSITIRDDSRAAGIWSPISLLRTKSKVVSLLQNATSTTVQLPKQPSVQFAAHMSPSQLNLITTSGDQITVYPEFYIAKGEADKNGNQLYETKYIPNVIAFNKNGRVTYLNDQQLYNWLKNDLWKTEFIRSPIAPSGPPTTGYSSSTSTTPSNSGIQVYKTEPNWAKTPVGRVTTPIGAWQFSYDVWGAGSVPNKDYTLWNPMYVSTGLSVNGHQKQLYQLPDGQSMPTAGNPTISILVDGEDPAPENWTCPQAIGLIKITGISGSIVSFKSISNVSGTFDLKTHQWTIR